jgi:hypothetical protein
VKSMTEQEEQTDPLKSKFAAINKRIAVSRQNEVLGKTEEGMRLVWKEVENLYSIVESMISELSGSGLPLVVTKVETGDIIMVHGPAVSLNQRLTLRFLVEGFQWNSVTDVNLERLIGPEGEFNNVRERLRYSPSFDGNRLVVWKCNQAVFKSEEVVTEALIKFADLISELLEDRENS